MSGEKQGILALGSHHGDDQIGWVLLQQLPAESVPAGVELEWISSPGLELFNRLQSYSKLLLLDAADLGEPPGTGCFYPDASTVLRAGRSPLSSHALGLQQALQLLQAMNIQPPEIALYLIQADSMEPMQPLSEALQTRLSTLVIDFNQELNHYFAVQ